MTNPAFGMPDELTRFAAALAGQYDVEREIGRGGMGVVYLAHDTRLDRRVAIKTLPAHLAVDPVVRERFLREARTAARLNHPNIVPIHRAGDLDGHVFFVMGFVDGDSLAHRVKAAPLTPREVVRQLRDVANALDYAHSNGVIHRDVKAENILIDRKTGRAMVTDFGIARLAEAAPLTSTGQVLGTVYYLSPEQVAGETIDARSDIYSLGVAGFFALSGRFPFEAELASAVLIAHVTKDAPPLLTVANNTPRELAEIIDQCLAKDPAHRFQSCSELAEALAKIESTTALEVAPSLDLSTAPSLISDTEAQAILGRAADLQAKTGLEPRPAPVAAVRDRKRDAQLTSGYSPATLRDAALEAGIPAQYVDHALAEHGLAKPAPVTAAPDVVDQRSLIADRPRSGATRPMIIDRAPDKHPLAGGRMRAEYEVIVQGEMPESDFDLLVDVLRRTSGESGQLENVGRSFSWQARRKREFHTSVLARNGQTTIRVSENNSNLAAGLFASIMAVGVMGSSGLWTALGFAIDGPVVGLLGWGVTAVSSYFIARGIFAIQTERRDDEARNLANRLAEVARQSIASHRE